MNSDPRVLMNEALSEYGVGSHLNSFRFLSKLSEITKNSGKPTYVLLYNQALTNVHLKRFAAATSIAENLFAEAEHLSEELSLRVCFLLLELHFYATRGYSSKEFQESEEYEKMKKILTFLKKSSHDSKEFKFRIHLVMTKIQLRIESTKQVKKEVKAALDLYESEIKAQLNNPPSVATSDSLRPTDSTWWCLAGKTRDALPTFLKANMEYARSNLRKTIRHLTNAKRRGIHDSVYFNGMGCAHFQLKSYDVASSFFARSLAATALESKERKSVTKKSNIPSHERRCVETTGPDVMYNSGLSLLKCNRPKLAFRCFQKASVYLHRDPLLWIRMAECCIAGWKKRRLNSNERMSQPSGSNFRRVVGQQSARRVLLPLSTREGDDEERDGEEKEMTMAHARTCVRNALILLQESGENNNSNNNRNAGVKDTTLLRKALLSSAFVSLCVSDHVEALRESKAFLARKDITDKQRCLASFYAAEALCSLNRPGEATKQLTGT